MDSQEFSSGKRITKITQSLEKYTTELKKLIEEIEKVEKSGAIRKETEKKEDDISGPKAQSEG